MKKWLLPLTLVCLLTGFFIVVQLKCQFGNTNINPLSQKNNNLITIINDLEKEIKLQEEQISGIRSSLGEMQSQQSKGMLPELESQLKHARIEAGILPVIGKGIQITIDDNTEGLKANPLDDPFKYIVHSENILNIVSELKAAGAEAIDVNGQRIITTSEIRCVGNVIMINTTRLAPPFVIQAIGSPILLYEMTGQREVAILSNSKYPVSIKEVEQLIIPAYKGDLQFNYAHIVKED